MVCHVGKVQVVARTARYSGIVRVVAVNPLSCATWAHSAWRDLRPGARYPGGNAVVPAGEQGDHPLLSVNPPSCGGVVPDHTWLGSEASGPASSEKTGSRLCDPCPYTYSSDHVEVGRC
jgi:hypothetical protein